MGAQNFKLVNITAHHLGQKDFPHPAAVAQTHGVTAPVPLVETADHRHPLGIGRPDRKARARHVGAHFRVRAQAFVRPLVRAFGEQPNVRIGKDLRESVGVVQQRGVGGVACPWLPVHP